MYPGTAVSTSAEEERKPGKCHLHDGRMQEFFATWIPAPTTIFLGYP
jgi:hypothetical protein